MPSIATRPVLRWLLVASFVGAAGAGAYLLQDDVEYRTCDEKLQILESLQPGQLFFAVMQDRADRDFALHHRCPTIEQIATERELIAQGYKTVTFVCNDVRVVAITSEPLVKWPAIY